MKQIDPAMARRVWQRVKGEAPAQMMLQELMEGLWEDGNIYRQLARRHRGRRAARFALLHRQSMEQLRLLKGLCALKQQCDPVFSQISPRREPEQVLLQRCYGRTLQRLSWYAANDADPHSAQLLPALIRQTQQHSKWLLELMARPNGR